MTLRKTRPRKPQMGDRLPVVPDSTWKRMSRIRTMDGPRCYLCNRLFRKGERMTEVALGPDQKREVFREATPDDSGDSVLVGAECLRKYVPDGSVVGERIR